MIVSNTTPISNFLHLNKIDILRKLFKKIYIPVSVKEEIEVVFLDNSQWQQCLKDKFFIIHEVKNPLMIWQFLTQLQKGEAEVLCVCKENSVKLCLLDDKDARNIATQNDIPLSGTLGILMQAKKMGLIESVKFYMDVLKNHHHFWISESMYNRVLRLSEEE